VLINGGLNKEKAEAALSDGLGDIAAFASSYLANPDLPKRFKTSSPLNAPDPDTFYTADQKGYTDYPAVNA
jgi:N-ethylmaleimide reductase